jgi:hypothetical protein
MKKTLWIVVLLLAVIGLAIVVVRQDREIARLRQQPPVTAAAESTPPPTLVVTAPQPPKPEPPAEVTPPETPPSPSPSVQSSGASVSNFFAGMAGMMKDPQMKEMIRAQQKMALDRMYGSLFKQLNWPAADVDKLKDLLLERQMAMAEAGMSMMGGSAEDRQRAVEDSKAIKADYDKKIQDYLGAEGYQVFQDYENTVNERMQIQMFKESLPVDTALSEQQEYDLIAVMYEERQALPPSSLLNNKTADPSKLTEENIAAALKRLEQLQQRYAERAEEILTPAQLEEFTKWQQQWSTMQAAGLKMASQMFGNKPAQPSPAVNESREP